MTSPLKLPITPSGTCPYLPAYLSPASPPITLSSSTPAAAPSSAYSSPAGALTTTIDSHHHSSLPLNDGDDRKRLHPPRPPRRSPDVPRQLVLGGLAPGGVDEAAGAEGAGALAAR